VSGVAHHRFKRGRGERCGGQIRETISSGGLRPEMLRHRENAGDAEGDSVVAVVGILGIVTKARLERLDELTLYIGTELGERPRYTGSAPVETAGGRFAGPSFIRYISRPQSAGAIELTLRARDDPLDRSARFSFAEAMGRERLVSSSRE